jgi:hypothetical protein
MKLNNQQYKTGQNAFKQILCLYTSKWRIDS